MSFSGWNGYGGTNLETTCGGQPMWLFSRTTRPPLTTSFSLTRMCANVFSPTTWSLPMTASPDLRALSNFGLLVSIWSEDDPETKGPRRATVTAFVTWCFPTDREPETMLIRWHQESWVRQVLPGRWGVTKSALALLHARGILPTFTAQQVRAWLATHQSTPALRTPPPSASRSEPMEDVEVTRGGIQLHLPPS